jgi:hypothetical protein
MSASSVRKKNGKQRLRSIILILWAISLIALLSSCKSRNSNPREADTASEQKSFASPVAAGAALLEAAKSGDETQLKAIFGTGGKDFAFTGDASKDKEAMKPFVDAYSQMNRWSASKSGDQVLYVGADNAAFPIPLTKTSSGQWVFNTAAGKDEVLARRVGDGELTAIGVLTEIASAQQQYFGQNHEFAQKLVSDQGQNNGLFSPTTKAQQDGSLNQRSEIAKGLGAAQTSKPEPFHGYFFKMLPQQSGNQDGGFTVIAWPANYQDSGVMTFVVGKDGKIYQKNLGANTATAASSIAAFNPSEGWTLVLAPESPNVAVATRITKE